MVAEAPAREKRPPERAWSKPDRRRRGAMGIGHVGLILGVVALALGGSGLAIALTHAGPAGAAGGRGAAGTNGTDGTNGATGPTGPQGPPGPGAVVNGTYTQEETGLTNATCGAQFASGIGFTVKGPGTVVVTASVELEMTHTAGDFTDYDVSLANASATCDVFANSYVSGELTTTLPTTTYFFDVSLVQTFPVTTAGTYTIDVIAEATVFLGSESNNFVYSSVAGVFYPS
jgi:hypothetical protein